MLGLITLGLMLVLIYGLVSLAVRGKVASTHAPKTQDSFSVCMILKDQHALSPLQLENNLKTISHYPKAEFLLMVQGLEAEIHAYEELQKRYPFLKILLVPNHPEVQSLSGWMMEELLKISKGDYLLMLHSQLDLDEHMIDSAVNECQQNNKAVFGLPQLKRDFFLTESIFALSPQLILASLKIPPRWQKNIHLFGLADFSTYFLLLSRKQLESMGALNLARQGIISPVVENLTEKNELKFMYGEKHLKRRLPLTRSVALFEVRRFWDRLISAKEKSSLILFILALLIWSFPWLVVLTHHYWALVGFFFLGIYRFFTKIIFQESWPNMLLHPMACVFWWYGLAQVLWAKRKA